MKKYFDQLRPMERRLVIGVAVVGFLVINGWQVWPHFSDWSDYSRRLDDREQQAGPLPDGGDADSQAASAG